MSVVRTLLLACFGLSAAGGAKCALAAEDPYAIHPFPVPYRTAPSDPVQRWAGFQSRVGTYLPTDAYHWWRFDIQNRAEVQDAFWNIEAVADLEMPDWTGSFPSTPGDVKQSWRDAYMRCVNLHRYYYMGPDTTYVQEDSDPYLRLCEQAAALIQSQMGLKHIVTAANMPAGFPFVDEAIFGSYHSNLGTSGYTSNDVIGFLKDGGNPGAGHRFSILNIGANLIALGRAGRNPPLENNNRPWTTVVQLSQDTTTTYQSGTNYGNPDYSTTPPPPQRDPFDHVFVYPYAGCITVDDMNGGTLPFSIDIPAGGLELEPTGISVTATRAGVPLTVTDVLAGPISSWRNAVCFTVAQGFFDYPQGSADSEQRLRDASIIVTVSGLRFRADLCSTPSGRVADMGAYIAASNPKAFQPHTLTWSFTVFDPTVTLPAPYPSSHSEITNLSTRAGIGAGNDVMIAGFSVTGTDPLRVAVRAQGPGLAQFGIQHPATNPHIDVYQQGDVNVLLGGNDDWKNGQNYRLLQSYGINPTDDREPAAIATLAPGNYTAVVSDGGAGGVGLVEVFALDSQSLSRLVNVSTRAVVGTGENALIGGFYLQTPSTVVVRTQGPTLARYGITNAASGTKLTIVRQSDHAPLATNAGWNAPTAMGNERLHTDLAGYAPLDDREAAQVMTLPAGAYTAVVETPDRQTGIGLVEIFHVN